jgi:hypothetical protein
MSGSVIELITDAAVNEAWERYASLARRVGNDLSLLTDRPFQEELARRHDRFRRLYLLQGRS